MPRLPAAILCAALVSSVSAAAQTPSRPGPWALDVRGVTSPVPDGPEFYPRLDASALVPARGFGLDVGAHVYLLNLGPSRLGLGADVIHVRGTTTPTAVTTTSTTGSTTGSTATTAAAAGQDVQVDLRLLAPQVSFNFGSRNGWSYLSAGVGTATTTVRTTGVITGRRESEGVRAINAGGGARWFIKSRLAFGFDVRMHRLSPGTAGPIEQTSPVVPSDTAAAPVTTPGMTIFAVSAGISFR